MGLKFKKLEDQPQQRAPVGSPAGQNVQARKAPAPGYMGQVGTPMGAPAGTVYQPNIKKAPQPPPLPMPSAGLKRAVNYYADYAGCGWWRMIMPETLINIEQKGVINGLTSMVLDPRFYQGIDCVRLQRQATPIQLQFVKFLKEGAKIHDFKLIYEIDDIIFKDDIPDFNRCKVAFEDEKIFTSSVEMMQLCDEISVTCQYMKDYYIDKTGNKNITVMPNYPAKMWMDGHYNPDKILSNYRENKARPRVAYIGSGTHIDVSNKTGQKDDFYHVGQQIIKTRHEFKWVFVGAFPLSCKKYIDNGDMEFVPWVPLKDLATAYTKTNCQAVYAPLVDCAFNRAKSNIKYLEAATCGIPGVFQDMATYDMAPLRFTDGVSLVKQLRRLLNNESTYIKYSTDARAYADTMWLDDHLDEYQELYFTKIGDPERKALLKNNPDQKTNITHENKLLADK